MSAGFAALLHPSRRTRDLLFVATLIIAIFGLVFLGFIVARADFSRATTLMIFAAAVVLIPAPYMIGASRFQQAMALAALLGMMLVAPFAISPAQKASIHSSAMTKTEYYNLDIDTYSGVFPKSVVLGGALGRIGDRYLLMTGDGHLHVFGWETGTDRLKVTQLPYQVPINGHAFSLAAKRPWARPSPGGDVSEGQLGAGSEILNTEWFRTYGLLVQEIGSTARIFASYPYWKSADECWVERVSVLEGDRTKFLDGATALEWKTLYETTPCLPIRGERRRHGIPFVGYFGGGKMALLNENTLLLTVGDFGFDGLASLDVQSQDPTTSYGKTIAVDIASGNATLFTLGHRNPEGLYIGQSGTIWSTEHGPQGGDELNRLIRGANYGWPYATDGTDYGSFSWPLNKSESEQRSYMPPVFAWVPSIAVSNLMAVKHDLFLQWRGDLLIASLKAKTLFRVRIRDGQIAYLEPIVIGSRIRDIIEGHDGRIILWTDEGRLLSLRPQASTTGEALFAEKCSGCHQSSLVGGNRIGPNLFGVMGRRIASLKSYSDYSSSLRQLDGVWTEERLNTFLKDPHTMSPGTTMDFAGANSSADRAAIVRYIGTLHP